MGLLPCCPASRPITFYHARGNGATVKTTLKPKTGVAAEDPPKKDNFHYLAAPHFTG
jgi:hypothetical protein